MCVARSMPVLRRVALADVGVEHADTLPVRLVLLDELDVPRGLLVGVVRLAAIENDLQSDVEIDLIDGASQIGHERSGGEENRSRMPGEILAARLDHLLDGGGGAILEREIDHVAEHGDACDWVWLFWVERYIIRG